MTTIQQDGPKKKITLKSVLARTFGVLFALGGLSSLGSETIPAIVMLILAAILIPPVYKYIEEKGRFTLSGTLKTVLIIFCLIIIGATVDTTETQTQDEISQDQEIEQNIDVKNEIEGGNNEQEIVENNEAEITPTEEETITETVSQKNAIRKAKSYLDYSGFSKSGLKKQLEFEGFSDEDSNYAVENIDTDWSKQAEVKAQSYLDISAYSRSGLIDQLKFEGFTIEEATYGVDAVGL